MAAAGKTGEIAYGFAKYLRDALPNASFIGFTGTPIEAADINTPAIFGDYIDIYDISRAVEDGATVPIYYESRLARIELTRTRSRKIDAEIDDLTEDEEAPNRSGSSANGRRSRRWSARRSAWRKIADDLVEHFEARTGALDGKAMVVCMSRRICVALYNEIVALRPDWHSRRRRTRRDQDRDDRRRHPTRSDWQPHIGTRKSGATFWPSARRTRTTR